MIVFDVDIDTFQDLYHSKDLPLLPSSHLQARQSISGAVEGSSLRLTFRGSYKPRSITMCSF